MGRFGYQDCTTLSFPAFLTDHPLSYVGPAVEELDAAFFTVNGVISVVFFAFVVLDTVV